MTTHRHRVRNLNSIELPPPMESERFKALLRAMQAAGQEHEVEAAAKEIGRRSRSLQRVQQDNGTGLLADSQLRWFVQEYNSRLIRHGLQGQPSSLNVVEAFVEFIPTIATFTLRPQLDFEFVLSDFLNRVTDGTLNVSLAEAVDDFQDGVVYNFEHSAMLGEFTLRDKEREFALAGISIVKHEKELSIVLVCGERMDLAKKTDEIKRRQESSNRWYVTPGKEAIGPAADLEARAEALPGSSDLMKLVILTRFDLDSSTQHVRHVMEDWGNSFTGLTDNPEVFPSSLRTMYEEQIAAIENKLLDYAVLFELCKICLWLPRYFEVFGELATEERKRTTYGRQAQQLSYADVKKYAPVVERIAYRKITTLRASVPEQSETRHASIIAPEMKIEQSGHWKTLAPTMQGTDKQGRPVLGKTWVSEYRSWVEKDLAPPVVAQSGGAMPSGPDPGWIYVLRSIVHPEDVFKVGFTRRTPAERAAELSGTATPDRFHVVNAWPSGNCAVSERQIHQKLAQFRLDPNREFFAAPFTTIRGVIERILKGDAA